MSELTGYGPGFPVGRAVETITKREYFAAMVMQGYLASYAGADCGPLPKHAAGIAATAVAFADALIAALKGAE